MPETSLYRPSKRARALFAASLAATLGFAGLAVASSSPAQAHTPNASATCEKLTVTTASYSAGADNTVTVEIDGATVEDDTSFGTSFSKDYAFTNSTEAHDWVVKVFTSDDPDGNLGYSVTDNGTSTPCAPVIAPPTVSASAEACTVPGGEVGKVDAEFGVTPGRDYDVSIAPASGGAALSTKPLDVAEGAGTASTSFSGLPTGTSYVVTVTDTAAELSSSDEVALGDCPDVPPTVEATGAATTCTPGGASIGTISAVVDGESTRGFTIDLVGADGTTAASQSTDGPATVTFEGLPSNNTYTVTVTDDSTEAEVSSDAITVPACVQPPVTPTPTPTPAAVVPGIPSTPAAASTGSLAETGFDPAPLAIGALAVLMLGGGAAFVTRRRATR